MIVKEYMDIVEVEDVASSGLDGVSAHRLGALTLMRGSMRNLLISKAGFTQVVDFQDRPYASR